MQFFMISGGGAIKLRKSREFGGEFARRMVRLSAARLESEHHGEEEGEEEGPARPRRRI